jgi:hypothetical protein
VRPTPRGSRLSPQGRQTGHQGRSAAPGRRSRAPHRTSALSPVCPGSAPPHLGASRRRRLAALAEHLLEWPERSTGCRPSRPDRLPTPLQMPAVWGPVVWLSTGDWRRELLHEDTNSVPVIDRFEKQGERESSVGRATRPAQPGPPPQTFSRPVVVRSG